MDDDHDLEGATGTPATASQAQDARAPSGRPGSADRRAERIQEYFAASLGDANPLRAVLGAATADLMDVRAKLAESIKAELGPGRVALEEYRRDFAPAVASLLLLDRQIVAYTRLGDELRRTQSSQGGDPRRREKRAGQGEDP